MFFCVCTRRAIATNKRFCNECVHLQSNYQGPDQELAAMLENDVMDHSPGVRWSDIAGLADGKRVLEEAAVLPLMMPEYFTGIRKPVKVGGWGSLC